MSSRVFHNLIWTNHALDRLEERKLSQSIAWTAFRYPDKVLKGRLPGSFEYQKRYQSSLITLIAKKNDQGEWVVLSVWIDPPLAGTWDAKKKAYWKEYQRAGFFGKWWVIIKQALHL